MNLFIINNRKGQTLIETALVLLILLIIVLGLAEFARAWFLKSSLKNAVRHGARVAVVTTTGVNLGTTTQNCPGSNIIIQQVCNQPGVPSTYTIVTVTFADTNSLGGLNAGDTVTVSATYDNPNFFIIGGGVWPWPKALKFTVDASMRYE